MMRQFNRVLLKLSGEALMGDKQYGIDHTVLALYSEEIKSIVDLGVQVAIVIGGGNIYRGMDEETTGIERSQGDYMGMLATIINGMALQSALEKHGINTRLQTAIRVEQVAEFFIRRRAIRHLEKGRVIIFGGGTGNPYFTTDTAGALRAIEINADVVLKGTRVDGVYDSDPEQNKQAKKFDSVSFKECITHNLRIMDMTAFTLCMENKLPIVVFNINQKGNLKQLILGNKIGTMIKG